MPTTPPFGTVGVNLHGSIHKGMLYRSAWERPASSAPAASDGVLSSFT